MVPNFLMSSLICRFSLDTAELEAETGEETIELNAESNWENCSIEFSKLGLKKQSEDNSKCNSGSIPELRKKSLSMGQIEEKMEKPG